MPIHRRPVVLTDSAERDFTSILAWTAKTFGSGQSRIYQAALLAAIGELTGDADTAKTRGDIRDGLRERHMARNRRRGRHVLFFEIRTDEIIVLRILHDRMDAARHISPEEPE